MRIPASGLLIAATLSAPGFAQDGAVTVKGGGSTFAAPLYEAWIDAYQAVAPTVDITYDVIGSGDGISGLLDASLDFGASDAPLTDAQEATIAGGVRHLPVTAGMVAVGYNLPGSLEGPLRLPRDVLGDIFAGAITDWDDPRLVAANPDLDLPSRTIGVVVRQDGSGTTYAFTNHLNATSETWRNTGVGVGTVIGWPGGAMRARGNEGIAANLQRADGTIGYVEYGLATRLGLPLAELENAAGNYILPSPESGAAAINRADLPADLKIDVPDPAGADAYPIVTFTWQLVRGASDEPARAEAIRAFTGWVLEDGQALAPALGYIPMPERVREQAVRSLSAAF